MSDENEEKPIYTFPFEDKNYTDEQYETLKQEFDWVPNGAGDSTTGIFLTGWYDAYHFYQYAEEALKYAANLNVPHCNPRDGYTLTSNPHNDCRDAFRHAYWSALMATHSVSDAKQIGDSHERTRPGSYEETHMDLHNNKVGREIGAANAKKTHQEIAALVAQALKEGRLITSLEFVPDPSRTKSVPEPKVEHCPVPEPKVEHCPVSDPKTAQNPFLSRNTAQNPFPFRNTATEPVPDPSRSESVSEPKVEHCPVPDPKTAQNPFPFRPDQNPFLSQNPAQNPFPFRNTAQNPFPSRNTATESVSEPKVEHCPVSEPKVEQLPRFPESKFSNRRTRS